MKKEKKKKGKAFSRRDFLKGLGGGTIGVAIAPNLMGQKKANIQTQAGKVPLYEKKSISMTVNGKKHFLTVEPRETLLEVLRERLNLTGAKKTCDRGECGGCTVLLNGEPVYSCHFLAFRADRKQITTIEGLASGKRLHPVQQAFVDKDAYQCGFCTPGFIMSTVALLSQSKNPHPDEIKQALSGNLCRCGNYKKIFEAVSTAQEELGRL